MFRLIAAVGLASAASLASAATSNISSLDQSAAWWERVTVTIRGDGVAQSCLFETSVQPNSSQSCQVEASQAGTVKGSGAKDQVTRLTFERRFSPGAPGAQTLQTGDTLLGRQVMALAIGAKGRVETCDIVDASGDMRPEYGCKEASAERFNTSAGSPSAEPRTGYMTITVYGHSEHVV